MSVPLVFWIFICLRYHSILFLTWVKPQRMLEGYFEAYNIITFFLSCSTIEVVRVILSLVLFGLNSFVWWSSWHVPWFQSMWENFPNICSLSLNNFLKLLRKKNNVSLRMYIYVMYLDRMSHDTFSNFGTACSQSYFGLFLWVFSADGWDLIGR